MLTPLDGFSGERLLVLEFAMPLSGNTECTIVHPNPDMPSIWAMASSIINNGQYKECTGWTAGAGEHDIAEVLAQGSKNMFASMHMGPHYAGTANDAFARPTTGTAIMAIQYTESSAQQWVLNNFDFPTAVDPSQFSGAGAGGTKDGAGAPTVMQLDQHPAVPGA